MIRVFPQRNKWTPTDALAFVGDPPLFRPPEQPVKVSVTFTWDIEEGLRLQRAWGDLYSDVKIGGCAFDDPGGEFVPGRFIKEGVTITSRGCPFNCDFCFVHEREGKIRELGIKPGNIVQDNNLLACSKGHIEKVFEMLQEQKSVKFSGGLDSKLLQDWHVGLLKSISLDEMWFACDHNAGLNHLERVSDLTSDFSINKKRCYVLIGFNNESLANAEKRLEAVYKLGFLPFAQLYRNENPVIWSKGWKQLNRKWSRPAIYRIKNLLNDDEVHSG